MGPRSESHRRRAGASDGQAKHAAGTLVFDGDCGFCSWCAAWLTTREVSAVPWQSLDLAAVALNEKFASEAAFWLEDDVVVDRAEGAIGRALSACGGVRGVAGRLLLIRGVRRVSAPIYQLVASNRWRFPGSDSATCRPLANSPPQPHEHRALPWPRWRGAGSRSQDT